MDGNERREKMLQHLEQAGSAVTGSALAKIYGVSRQAVVQDIALLRAAGENVISTAEGYRINNTGNERYKRVYCVSHKDSDLEDELNIFVDNGGHLLDIFVDHEIYGEITVELHLKNRRQIERFIEKIKGDNFVPLMHLTGGVHYHTVAAEDQESLQDIERELRLKGYLIEV